MKSQIYVFIMAMLPLVGDVIKAQPKLSIDMGIGFYEPTLVGFDQNERDIIGKNKVNYLNLGENILRAETAPVAALSRINI